jgi:two-component system chemotaxis response regulator CheB
MSANVIRVLVVDDSALARRIIGQSLAPFPDIEIVGMAADPYIAREKIIELNPDVVTLDIEMPRMDGLTFLKLIMKHRPMPVIIMSSLTTAGSLTAMEALQAGAVEVMDKPNGSYSAAIDGTRLAEKIRAAACARVCPGSETQFRTRRPSISRNSSVSAAPRTFPARKIVLLGASTGGTEALKTVLTSLPEDMPGICIVQHIPAYFSRAFADRLNRMCDVTVREAEVGDIVKPGLALVAPGGLHMRLKWEAGHYKVELTQEPMVHYQRPAVDILFESAVLAGAGPFAVAGLLTGMGCDGAQGLLRLKEAGATTIAQDEETCVVFGMPREAIRLGAAQHILPLQKIGAAIDSLVGSTPSHTRAAGWSQTELLTRTHRMSAEVSRTS